MFALAMDRLLPAKLAEVNRITTVPTWATHVTGVIGLAGAALYYFKVGTVLGTLMFCTMFIVWPMGLAVIILPFRQPDLIRLDWMRTRRVLGLPLASWLGVVTFASGLLLLYLAGREIPGKVWIGILVVLCFLLGNYYFRTRLARVIVVPEEKAALLPPE
jgi:amino acid transporter